MKKLLIAFAVTAFAVTAFAQDKPKEVPAQKQCKECCCCKGDKATCKGDKACDKKADCKKVDCPKAKKS